MKSYSLFKVVTLAAVAFVLTLGLGTQAEAQDRVKWKMHSAWGSSLPHLGTSGVRFSKNIERLSGGKFTMKFFEPGALIPANEGFDAVSKGSIESAWTTAGYDTGKYPALSFFTAVPFGPTYGEYFAWKKFGGGDDESVIEAYEARFRCFGVDPQRVTIVGHKSFREHFALYNQIDIALDTFPYCGTTTTCEAFVMGVPTVSWVGTHHASRVGNSLLSRIGLEIFTAHSAQEYVQKAVSFAGQLAELSHIRKSLRGMLMDSSLTDAEAYAQCVEQAYRKMWQTRCSEKTMTGHAPLETVEHGKL